MTFQPFVSGSGLSSWSLLNLTLKKQKSAFKNNFIIRSDVQYFLDRFKDLDRAEDITEDRRVLRVILGAYGLIDDIENKFFIRKILEEGVTSQSALANKLSDRRYRNLAFDFDFSMDPPRHKTRPDLARNTSEAFQNQAFEVKIGEVNPDMRLALGFAREFQKVAQSATTNSTAWYQVLATPPLRKVVQTALGLPDTFAKLDIDDQHARIRSKADSVLGTNDINQLSSGVMTDVIIRRFLLLREVETLSSTSSLQTALILLSSSSAKRK